MSESSKPGAIQIDSQRVMGGHQHIDSHIKFFVTDKQWIMDIPLDDVWLGLVSGVSPVADVSDRPEQEDPFSLTTADLAYFKVTGFIIQMHFWSLFFLNSSAKMGYSLGRL
jgi:hypothetical protein